MNKVLSDKVIKRLTLYHSILADFINKKIEYISSPQIADLLHIDNTQVRKDIALLKYKGKCKVGYKAYELKNLIEETLKFKTVKTAFIVGAGNLGMALAKYDNFKSYGFDISALFDNNSLKIGTKINGKTVFDIKELPKMADKFGVKIAILTVPGDFAQEVTSFLVQSDIKYIWNFTPCVLNVPDNIQVWNENLIGNFLQFTVNIEGEKN
ncbi:MAG: redox-sensing transcriptional repressor Rex [Candidatus Gastranaerophilales bacterium]|nr:redox-sensing transcriptional repressor Rex [Candidatus Gastranaerophilales bacterium]